MGDGSLGLSWMYWWRLVVAFLSSVARVTRIQEQRSLLGTYIVFMILLPDLVSPLSTRLVIWFFGHSNSQKVLKLVLGSKITKLRLFDSFILSILLYGAESWITTIIKNQSNSFAIICYCILQCTKNEVFHLGFLQ